MPRKDREHAARHIRARRGQAGLSQQELADAAGMDVKTVWNAESGLHALNARNAGRLSEALGWPVTAVSDLYAGAEPPAAAGIRAEPASLIREAGWEDPDRAPVYVWTIAEFDVPDDEKRSLLALAARNSGVRAGPQRRDRPA